MTLGELLTLLRESILNDRSDRESGSADYLWTDQTLVTFINEAHRRFARRGLILRDATTDVATKIILVAGQTIYPLHESVISVISAKMVDQNADLTRVGHSIFSAYSPPTENWIDPASYNSYPPGPTLAYSTDEAVNAIDGDTFEQVSLRVHPTPRAEDAGKVIRLRVVREPINDFVLADLDAIPEIPRAHHLEMLDWAAYLSLRIVDDDAGAPKRAAEFAQSFETHVKEARNLAMRKMFSPMGWGFGRGGFSWSN
jgi:hypothetical protein